MSFDLWAAYAIAAGILLAIPGPTILLVISYGIAQGRRAAYWTVPGVALGDLVAMTVSLAGLGAILATSAFLFSILKWIGAAYLVYLGIKLWRSGGGFGDVAVSQTIDPGPKLLVNCFIVTALNPKGIIFFMAFVPQFLTAAAPVTPQLVIMGLTFLVLAVVNAAIYAVLAGSARTAFQRPSVAKIANRVGGGLLVGAGAMTAAYRSAQ